MVFRRFFVSCNDRVTSRQRNLAYTVSHCNKTSQHNAYAPMGDDNLYSLRCRYLEWRIPIWRLAGDTIWQRRRQADRRFCSSDGFPALTPSWCKVNEYENVQLLPVVLLIKDLGATDLPWWRIRPAVDAHEIRDDTDDTPIRWQRISQHIIEGQQMPRSKSTWIEILLSWTSTMP